MTNLLGYLRDLYARFERPISSLSLIGGFIFDAVTLQRIDTFWDNFWVVIHLFIVAVCILLINLERYSEKKEDDPREALFWLINIMQFVFGGLLSTFLVFYFRSAALSVSWPFLLLLALAFIANERLKRHYSRLAFQIALFYLCLFSFTIFLVPVVVHRIGTPIFLLSGFLSLFLMWLFVRTIWLLSKERFYENRPLIARIVILIFVIMNVLYFTNVIPPIPLSLKDSAVYHYVAKFDTGGYMVTYEDQGFWGFLNMYDNVHVVPGQPIFVYSAVFAPTNLNINIVHVWQHEDGNGAWSTTYRVSLPVVGGRAKGYRTYSSNTDIAPGRWRVYVETSEGQVIGTIRFNAIPSSKLPPLITEVS